MNMDTSPHVLALYDVEAKTKICADIDASSHAVLLQQQQQQNSCWPVAFVLLALSETDRHYVQIALVGCGEVFRIHSGKTHYIGN